MTGTTRYITTGFDWVFRWLTDITFDADTSDIVGFTRKDLETTFFAVGSTGGANDRLNAGRRHGSP